MMAAFARTSGRCGAAFSRGNADLWWQQELLGSRTQLRSKCARVLAAFATGAEVGAPQACARLPVSKSRRRMRHHRRATPKSKGKGGLARPSSSSVLRPTTLNVQRLIAHPSA